MKDDSFDCTLIAHLRIFLLFYRLLYCLILPENRLFFGIWKVVEIGFLIDDIGLGMCLGVMMGVSIGPAIDVLRKNMKSEEQEDNDEKE